jgi:acetylornithine deacetylase/succinyl-diaminopimelate desuccinylase-like protein
MNLAELNDVKAFVDSKWDNELIPCLTDYIRIPAKSPAFDASWAEHGHLHAVIKLAQEWALKQPGNIAGNAALAGMQLEVIALDGKTPCIFFDVPATQGLGNSQTVLFYGHLDKQPEMTGWRENLGPWTPVIENDKLYGRGSADDGYALFASLTALAALDKQGAARPRCVGLIETCEESGSPDLPAYLDMLMPRLGDVKLVVGLDSGCGNYDQLWVTTSLRGLVGGVLNVEILTEGVHSGSASGIVPSSFRIARQLLNRIDDPASGKVLLSELYAPIPAERHNQALQAGEILGDSVWKQFPWVSCDHAPNQHLTGARESLNSQPTSTDPVECILNRTWRPALSVTGMMGLPPVYSAGNVLRPNTKLKLSMRIPPTVNAREASQAMKKAFEQNTPYNAKVSFDTDWGANGWNAPEQASWLTGLLEKQSMANFGKSAAYLGEGGTIPFMNMLGEKFPAAQFLITGVLGPNSNAHGPNEFLHIPYVKKLTTAVAGIVAGMAIDAKL